MNYLFGLFANKQQGLLVVFFFYTLTHAFFIFTPPKGGHLWRQCNTSAVARNFVEEDMNLFHPRVDRRGDTNGITGMQFPSFEYTVALIAKVVGYYDGLNRLVAFLYFGMGMAYFYALLRLLYQNNTIAFCGTWAFTFSPILYYHSITALPDVLALSASIAGLYYFFRWNENNSSVTLLLSLFFTTLAGLTKLQYLAIGFPIAVVVVSNWRKKQYTLRDNLSLTGFAIVSIGLSLAWYAYALHLIKTSGLADFGLEFRPVQSLSEGLSILWVNLYSHFTEQLISIPNLIPFFAVAFWYWKTKPTATTRWWIWGVWALGLLAYHLIELRQMDVHMYYMFPYLPLLFIVVAKGYGWLLQKNLRVLVLLVLISLPILAFAGNFHHYFNPSRDLPKDFYNTEQREALDAAIPAGALTLVGPDESGCIYHYFTHTKGFTFGPQQEFSASYLNDCLSKGAHYLVWRKELAMPAGLAAHVKRKLDYQGSDLEIYELK